MLRRRITLILSMVVISVLSVMTAGPVVAADPCHDPASASYSTHDCKVTRLEERPWVVIATVDTGINPYHEDFRLPPDDDMQGVHPSEFIEGYPAATPALNLSLDAPSVAAAREQDAQAWETTKNGHLVWIPGTNIIGGYAPPPSAANPATDFYDTGGHGTGVASVSGGRLYGRGGENVLIVSVTGNADGWQWAANQPWIDLISISWGNPIPVLADEVEISRSAVESGKINCVATGNYTVPLWTWESQGPSWNVNVGAVDVLGSTDGSDQVQYYSAPGDLVAHSPFTAAAPNTMTGTTLFGGTSAATPHACAIIARTISAARARLGDTSQGPHNGGLASGAPAGGALADGVLTGTEIEDAVQSTAVPVSIPGDWVRSGYGIVSAANVQAAVEVIFGERSRPARPEEDRWIQATDTLRDALYGEPPGTK